MTPWKLLEIHPWGTNLAAEAEISFQGPFSAKTLPEREICPSEVSNFSVIFLRIPFKYQDVNYDTFKDFFFLIPRVFGKLFCKSKSFFFSVADFHGREEEAVPKHMSKKIPCPVQLILVASEGPEFFLQFHNGFTLSHCLGSCQQ